MVTYAESKREWYEAIGEFVVEFEHLCGQARSLLTFDFERDDDKDKVEALLVNVSARQLIDSVEMVLTRTGRLLPADLETLARFAKLNTKRNLIVHTQWFIGWGNTKEPPDPYNVVGSKVERSPKAVDPYQVAKLNIEEVRAATVEIDAIEQGLAAIATRLFLANRQRSVNH